MCGEEPDPRYELISEGSELEILGREMTTGEEMRFTKLYFDKSRAEEIVFLLNKNKVSLCHAKDIIRDKILNNFL